MKRVKDETYARSTASVIPVSEDQPMWRSLVDSVRSANGFPPYHKRKRRYVVCTDLGPVYSSMAPIKEGEFRGLPVPTYDICATLSTIDGPVQTDPAVQQLVVLREQLARYADIQAALQSQTALLNEIEKVKKEAAKK